MVPKDQAEGKLQFTKGKSLVQIDNDFQDSHQHKPRGGTMAQKPSIAHDEQVAYQPREIPS